MDGETAALCDQLSSALSGDEALSYLTQDQVRDLADLQLITSRVRAAKAELLKATIPTFFDLDNILDQYERADRYERRALSQKKTLLRVLMAKPTGRTF